MRNKILDLMPGILLNVMLAVGLVAASSIAELGAGAQSWSLASAELSPVVGGQFCAKSERGQTRQGPDGAWYRCALKGDAWRWLPTSSPAPSVKPTTAKPKPTKTSAYAAGKVPTLPRTPVAGGALPFLAGLGVLLVVAGGLSLFMIRTRRYRFRA